MHPIPRVILLSFVLLAPVTSISAQISSERPVSTPVYEPVSPAGFAGFAAASDGNGFLVAWTDGIRLCVVPLGADGVALIPAAIVLAASPDDYVMGGVAVVWSGDAYTVFWGERRRNGTAPAIAMQRVAADGHIVAERRTIASAGSISQFHAVAANGGHIVLWTTAGYIVLDEQGNQIASGPFGSAAYIGSVFSTGSAELTLINAFGSMRLDASGRTGSVNVRKTPTYGPRLACHGDDCLIVYQSGMNAGALLTGARFNAATSEVGETIVLPVGASLQYDVAATLAGYVVTTPTSILRLDDSGRSQGITPLPSSESWSAVEAVSSGRGTLVLLAGKTLSTSLVTSSGVSQPVIIARAANSQQSPAIVTNGSQYFTVWKESQSVYAARLSLDGIPLDGRGILLGSVNAGAPSDAPSVAFDGQNYAIAFQTSAVPGAFFQTSASATDILHIDPASGVVVSRQTICAHHLRIAAGGGILNAAWIDCAGEVVSGPLGGFPVIVAKTTELPYGVNAYPSLAWNGSSWLVTWEEQLLGGLGPEPYNYYFYTAAIRAARLSAWLTPLDTKPIEVATSEEGAMLNSRVASDGTDFLVAWDSSYFEQKVHARRVTSSGITGSADTLVMPGRFYDLVWDGNQFALSFSTTAQGGDVGIAHIRSTGNPLAFETLAISATPDVESDVSLLSLGNGRVLAAYTRFAREPLYGGASRVFVATPRPPRGRASRESQ